LLLFVLAAALHAQSGRDSCTECHAALGGPLAEPVRLFEQDLHRKLGFSCADCHGGNPTTQDLARAKGQGSGFVGRIDRRAVPERCARCHSDADLIHRFSPQQRVDQLALYRTSVHGRRLASGDTRVANCVDCHSVHDIRPVEDAQSPVHPLRLPQTCARCHSDPEHMKGYPIPYDQFEQYSHSVHWEALAKRGDLSAPSCATCHGNHGAAPPGVASVAHVCGSCHVVFEDLFVKSPHKPAFDQMGLAGCVVCHGSHDVARPTMALVGVQEGSLCLNCHGPDDKGYEAAAAMRSSLEGLAGALAQAEAILDRAEASGMEVSEGRLELSAAQENLIKARVDLHSFDPAVLDAAAGKGLAAARAAFQAGEKALAERDYRRKGLALALIAIAATMAGLWLAVRELERRRNQA
jgi:predicted CXXCH cytochrome family protein